MEIIRHTFYIFSIYAKQTSQTDHTSCYEFKWLYLECFMCNVIDGWTNDSAIFNSYYIIDLFNKADHFAKMEAVTMLSANYDDTKHREKVKKVRCWFLLRKSL